MKTRFSNLVCATFAAVAVLYSAVVAIADVTQNFSCFTSECWRRADVKVHPRLLPNVELQDTTGRKSKINDLSGSILVVNFMYASCETICNTLGSVSSQLATKFASEIKQGKVKVVSISFDPNRDTVKELQSYQKRLDRSRRLWVVVRPTSEIDNDSLKKVFGIVAIKDGRGGIDHNAALHIVDKTNHLVRIADINDLNWVEKYVRYLL